MPGTSARVKKQVLAEFTKAKLTLSETGDRAVDAMWDQTLGHFFKRYRATAEAKWRKKRVRAYGMRAVKAIVKECGRLSKGGAVGATHVRKASKKVIKRFRRVCPPEVRPGALNAPSTVQLHGGLCELVPT